MGNRARKLLCAVMPLLLAVLLSACGSSGTTGPNVAAISHYSGLTCAPFARELSGVALYGDAGDWWGAARGRYQRANTPQPGAVLVFQREGRVPSGHVAVVAAIRSARQIEVIQANWVPNELHEDELVVDVSPGNDWTEVRVWYPPSNAMGGHVYRTYGFILPPRPASHGELTQATAIAARLALNSHGDPPRARYAAR